MAKEKTKEVKKEASFKRTVLRKTLILAAIILPFLALAAFGGYYYQKFNELNRMSAKDFQNRENAKVLKEVGKLYALPKDEEPVIGYVSDKEALKKQYDFFNQAENGDITLIYQQAKLAILYRPQSKQIVNTAPLNIQNQQPVIKVLGKESDRAAVEKALNDNKLTFSVAGDPVGTHSGVIVVDVKGTNAQAATNLANIVKGKVEALPAGENTPENTDLLIIVGSPAE
jgi:nitrate reductase NapE component